MGEGAIANNIVKVIFNNFKFLSVLIVHKFLIHYSILGFFGIYSHSNFKLSIRLWLPSLKTS